jgi:hypothetical protein
MSRLQRHWNSRSLRGPATALPLAAILLAIWIPAGATQDLLVCPDPDIYADPTSGSSPLVVNWVIDVTERAACLGADRLSVALGSQGTPATFGCDGPTAGCEYSEVGITYTQTPSTSPWVEVIYFDEWTMIIDTDLVSFPGYITVN